MSDTMADAKPIRFLRADVGEVADAFESDLAEAHHSFDLETGHVVIVTDKAHQG